MRRPIRVRCAISVLYLLAKKITRCVSHIDRFDSSATCDVGFVNIGHKKSQDESTDSIRARCAISVLYLLARKSQDSCFSTSTDSIRWRCAISALYLQARKSRSALQIDRFDSRTMCDICFVTIGQNNHKMRLAHRPIRFEDGVRYLLCNSWPENHKMRLAHRPIRFDVDMRYLLCIQTPKSPI